MGNIQLFINDKNLLQLVFQDAVHPALIHPKADHWNFIYKIYRDQVLFDNGLYNNNYVICEQRQLLIIEEYDFKILDKDSIKIDDDIVKNLRLFDFNKNKTGKFSKVTGGHFLLRKFIDNNFIFGKQ